MKQNEISQGNDTNKFENSDIKLEVTANDISTTQLIDLSLDKIEPNLGNKIEVESEVSGDLSLGPRISSELG